MEQTYVQQSHWSSVPYTGGSIESILKNIDGNIQGPVNNFTDRYFGHLKASQQGREFKVCSVDHTSIRECVPLACPEDSLSWFFDFLSDKVDRARGSWHIANAGILNKDAPENTGSRVILAAPPPSAEDDTEWGDAEVIGQIYRNQGIVYQDGLLQLCWSAQQVFSSQPMRRFLHGFYIRGALVEFWMFDRSGLYCSAVLDIHKSFQQFLTVILGYEVMSPEELGHNKIFKNDTVGRYVQIPTDNSEPEKLYIDNTSIAVSGQIVGSGLLCFPARKQSSSNWTHVIKFKW